MNTSATLIRPHITEKATRSAESDVYVFQVLGTSTKKTITRAIVEQYKVTPVKVSVVTIPAKETFVRGKRGMKAGYKKAYIYLKKGDKIEII